MKIQTYDPNEGIHGPGNAKLGNMAGADAFGAANYKDLYNFGGAVKEAGSAQMDWAFKRQAKIDRTIARDSETEMANQFLDERTRLDKLQGSDAMNLDQEVMKFYDGKMKEMEKKLNPKQMELFKASWDSARYNSMQWADSKKNKEVERFSQERLAGQNLSLIRQSEVDRNDPNVVVQNWDKIAQNIREQYRGSPPEYIAAKTQAAKDGLHKNMAMALGSDSPDKALDYLNGKFADDMDPVEKKTLKEHFGKAKVEGVKKESENQYRKMGIALGEKYDSEIEIRRALYEIDDRELASIAFKEADAIRKARLEGGEEKASDRENSAWIAAGANDETEVYAKADALVGVAEKQREKILGSALARFRAKKTAETAAQIDDENSAMKTLADAKWDPSAISPGWSPKLQIKMTEIAGKMRKNGMQADPVKALEHAERPVEELQQMIKDGKWLDIAADCGGAGTPEYKLVWDKAYKGEGSGAKGKPLQTPLQFAKTEFTALTGIRPSTKQGAQSYEQYIRLFNDAAADKAGELGVEVGKLPREELKKISSTLLAEGEYDEGILYWGRSMRRYEVLSDANKDEKYFAPNTVTTKEKDIPAYAKPYLGVRDQSREVLPNGTVKIINQFGKVTAIRPDGSRKDYEPVIEEAKKSVSLGDYAHELVVM